MGAAMTGTATLEFLHHRRVVRSGTMAIFAGRNIAMGVGMTQGAIENRVFLAARNEFFVNFGMATGADIIGNIIAIGLSQRRMDRMTCLACRIVFEGQVRFFMTLQTAGDIAMSGMVTIGACHFGMR